MVYPVQPMTGYIYFVYVKKKIYILGSNCQHYFCKDCYRAYCEVKIAADGKL